MIGSSVSDPQWPEQVSTGRPTLVVAEGLVMFLPEGEVRQLLDRLTDRFDCGELFFDTLSRLAPLLSKVLTKRIIKWGIRDARELETWNREWISLGEPPAGPGRGKSESTAVRLMYMFFMARRYDVLNRFEY